MVNVLSVIALIATSSSFVAAVPDDFKDILNLRRDAWAISAKSQKIIGETNWYVVQANAAVHDAMNYLNHAKYQAKQADFNVAVANQNIKNATSQLEQVITNVSVKQLGELVRNLDNVRRNAYGAMHEKTKADYRVSRTALDEAEVRDHYKSTVLSRDSAHKAIRNITLAVHTAQTSADLKVIRDAVEQAHQFRRDAITYANLAANQRSRAQRSAAAARNHAGLNFNGLAPAPSGPKPTTTAAPASTVTVAATTVTVAATTTDASATPTPTAH